jgi:hypothetical protein
MSELPPIGGNNSEAFGVNNRGQAVGIAETAVQDPSCVPPQVLDFEAVIWGPKPGQIEELPLLPGDSSGAAVAINDKGQVVGLSGSCSVPTSFAVPSHAVLWDKGVVTYLGGLGGAMSNSGTGINKPGTDRRPIGLAWRRNDAADCTQFATTNTLDLCPGGVSAVAQFWHDFVLSLINQNARTDAILGYELRNEYVYDLDQPPLSWTSGTVTTADGHTYDMSSATSRQQMMDNGLIYFTDHVRAAILALDPTALVDVGFFDTGQGSANSTQVYPAIANSTADFVDIHAGLPAPGLDQVAQDIGFVGYQQQKPILMGEFTANESDYPLISDAATALQNWQLQSCTYSFKGWLLWAWDTEEAEQQPLSSPPYWWSAVSGDGSINTALAPAVRPDPCQ